MLICLIILTGQCVHSKVIIVNGNNGNDNTECCVNGECACSSLSTALFNIANNTIINITSESVALNNTTTMGSGKLTNITITGSNVTIMCNNSGSVYCESCDDVKIEGITWDRCGDPNGTHIAGVTFNGTSNISLVNCTFQQSLLRAVCLLEVSNNILIHGCNFLSNIPMQILNNINGILSITRKSPQFSNDSSITMTISESYFYNNGYLENFSADDIASSFLIDIEDNSVTDCNVILLKTKFTSNRNITTIGIIVSELINIQLNELLVFNNSFFFGTIGGGFDVFLNSNYSDVVLSVISSNFNAHEGSDIWCEVQGNNISIIVNNSTFMNNKPAVNSSVSAMSIFSEAISTSIIKFYRVQFNNNMIGIPLVSLVQGVAGALSIVIASGDVEINMYMVNFTSNQYLGHNGGALYVFLSDTNNSFIHVEDCQFVRNKSPGHGAALLIFIDGFKHDCLQIRNTHFDQNTAGSSVVYITQDYGNDNNIDLKVNTSTFVNNIGSSMHLSACDLEFSGVLMFKNNTAENGGALYLNQGTTIAVGYETTVQFIANTAAQNGGAIYVDFLCDDFLDYPNTFSYDTSLKYSTVFINNSAIIAGNSLYFGVPKFCSINTNISDYSSVLYRPCQFNYSQPIKGKMIHIPCDLDYTLLNGTGAPIVTSPHELRLYFPYNDGYNISSTSDHNVYFVRNNILGHPVKFTGAVFDYLRKPTEPTLFKIQLQYQHKDTEESFEYTFINDNTSHDDILTQSIDDNTILNVNFKGQRINATYLNLTLLLTSLSSSFKKINATLYVELVPCIDHPGYTYSEESQTCVCYHHNVKCNDDGNEIKRGYWFSSIDSKAKQPHHYVLTTIVRLHIVNRLVKIILNYLIQLMLSVMITELEELVGNAVQDTLYHMTPLTVSV